MFVELGWITICTDASNFLILEKSILYKILTFHVEERLKCTNSSVGFTSAGGLKWTPEHKEKLIARSKRMRRHELYKRGRGCPITCLSFGKNRKAEYPDYLFFHGCDILEDAVENGAKRANRQQKKYECTAGHSDLAHPTTLKRQYRPKNVAAPACTTKQEQAKTEGDLNPATVALQTRRSMTSPTRRSNVEIMRITYFQWKTKEERRTVPNFQGQLYPVSHQHLLQILTSALLWSGARKKGF